MGGRLFRKIVLTFLNTSLGISSSSMSKSITFWNPETELEKPGMFRGETLGFDIQHYFT